MGIRLESDSLSFSGTVFKSGGSTVQTIRGVNSQQRDNEGVLLKRTWGDCKSLIEPGLSGDVDCDKLGQLNARWKALEERAPKLLDEVRMVPLYGKTQLFASGEISSNVTAASSRLSQKRPSSYISNVDDRFAEHDMPNHSPRTKMAQRHGSNDPILPSVFQKEIADGITVSEPRFIGKGNSSEEATQEIFVTWTNPSGDVVGWGVSWSRPRKSKEISGDLSLEFIFNKMSGKKSKHERTFKISYSPTLSRKQPSEKYTAAILPKADEFLWIMKQVDIKIRITLAHAIAMSNWPTETEV